MPPGSRRRSELATPTNEQIGSISGDQYISISDFIYLHDEALGGFISVEGFTDAVTDRASERSASQISRSRRRCGLVRRPTRTP